MKQRIVLLLAVAVLTVSALIPGAASAQQGNGFVISPVLTERTIEKGKSDTVTVTVENPTADKVNAQLVVNDFEPSASENGKPQLILDSNQKSDANSFKQLVGDLGKLQLAAREKREVKVKIAVPQNAAAGGYYGAIRVQTDTSGAEKNASLAASVASLFLIRVPGDLTESMELVELTAAKNGNSSRFFLDAKNMSVITRLKNTGTIHLKPVGKITVTDSNKNIVQQYEFNIFGNGDRSNVLPNSIRKFEDKLKDRTWFGKYTVTADLGYGSGGNLITATNSFWAFPLWFVIVIGLAFLAVIVAIFVLYRKIAGGKLARTRRRR